MTAVYYDTLTSRTIQHRSHGDVPATFTMYKDPSPFGLSIFLCTPYLEEIYLLITIAIRLGSSWCGTCHSVYSDNAMLELLCIVNPRRNERHTFGRRNPQMSARTHPVDRSDTRVSLRTINSNQLTPPTTKTNIGSNQSLIFVLF